MPFKVKPAFGRTVAHLSPMERNDPDRVRRLLAPKPPAVADKAKTLGFK